MALTPQGDRIFYAEILNGYWDASRIRNVRVPREGHCYHVRSADDFNKRIAAFAMIVSASPSKKVATGAAESSVSLGKASIKPFRKAVI